MNKLYHYALNGFDFEQMSSSESMRHQAEVINILNQENKEKENGFWQKVSGENNSFFYKFYFLDGKGYVSTNNLNFQKLGIHGEENVDHFFSSFKSLDSDILIERDFFKANGRYFRLISLSEFPDELDHGDLQVLGDYMVFLSPISQAQASLKLKFNRNIHYSSLASAGPRNIEAELSHAENEQLYSDLLQGSERLFRCEVFFIIHADTEVELNKNSDQLIDSLKILGAHPFTEGQSLFGLLPNLLASNSPKFLRAKDVNSSYLFNLLPLQKDSLMEEGVSFESLGGNNVKFNLFDQNALNFNALVSGESGSGKSMLVQKLAFEEYKKGAGLLILDLGNSFLKLARYNGAKTFSQSFNPYQFKNPHFLKEFCLSFIDDGEITKKEEGILFRVIENAIQDEKITNFFELLELIDHELSGFSLYFEEFKSYISTERHEEADFVYVDTTIFPEKIKKGLILYLFEYFKHFKTHEKLFVIDECWDLLKGNASYIEECFRTFRKHRASAIAISQSIGDFTKDTLGDAIANNSFYKVFLRQGLGDSAYFDDFDKDKIKNLFSSKGQYSELYLKSSIHRKALRYYPTNLEYELFTSSREDNIKLDKFVERNIAYFDFSESLNRWVDFKYSYQLEEGK